MEDVQGFPYAEIEFTKDGSIYRTEQVDELLELVGLRQVTDLFVIAHGWNNHMDEARALYRALLLQVREEIKADRLPLADRTFGVLGVLWPAKRFAEKELIPSGAAAVAAPITEQLLEEQLEDLKGAFDGPEADSLLERAKALVPQLEDSADARRQFVELLRGVVPEDSADDDEDASGQLFALPGGEVMDRLSRPVMPAPGQTSGGQAANVPSGGKGGAAGLTGAAAGIGQWFSGIRAGARNFLNFLTYYQMKARAGKVGSDGVSQVLRTLGARHSKLKLHLVGHSFGARLVTAAALGGPGQPPLTVNTLTLLQAAFSHYGFAEDYEADKDGLFRAVIATGIVPGPVVISHTKNDRAVGLAYPLASLLAGQVAAALGDENDKYGGLGRNGAQKTPEAHQGVLLDTQGVYAFDAGHVYNLKADDYISDHGDIAKAQVAHALLAAVAVS